MKVRALAVIPLLLSAGCSSISYTFFKDEKLTYVATCQGVTEQCSCTTNPKRSECAKRESKVYRGTKEDLFFVALPFAFLTADSKDSGPVLWLLPLIILGWPVGVVDLPLSFVSDTILLPYTTSLDKKPIEIPNAGRL